MSVENLESRPTRLEETTYRAGAVLGVGGLSTAILAGFGNNLVIAGAGGAVMALGMGSLRIGIELESRREANMFGTQMKMGFDKGPKGKFTKIQG